MSRERWQELDGLATPGPWRLDDDGFESTTAMAEYHPGHPFPAPVAQAVWTNCGYAKFQIGAADAAFIAAARTAWPAAERECDQLRADNAALRTELLMLARTANPSTPSEEAVVRQELDEANAAAATAQGIVGDIGAENSQLRAERDQAFTLLRAIRRLSEPQPNDSMNAHFSPIAKMIDAAGLLDDEGQQP